jgi:hypothetical protein
VIGVAETGTVAGVADPGCDARSSPQICRRRVRVDGDPTPSAPRCGYSEMWNLSAIIEELEQL